MRVILVRALAAVVALTLCAPLLAQQKKAKTGDPTADGMVEYKDAKHNFKIKYPATWSKTTSKDSAIAFANTTYGQTTDEIAVSLEGAKKVKRTENNLDLIMAEVEVDLRKSFTDFKVISEQPMQLSGFPGRNVVFTGRRDGVLLEMNLTFTVAVNDFYMITEATTPQRYEAMLPTFQAVTGSFEIAVQKKKN